MTILKIIKVTFLKNDENINKQVGHLDDAAKIILEINKVLISGKVDDDDDDDLINY